LEDFKAIWLVACREKSNHATFLLTDNDIKSEEFLEFVNSFLSTGEVSNMLEKADKDTAQTEVAKKYGIKDGVLTVEKL
jgi:hypothetical protein